MRRPNIGITAATENVSYGVWDEVAAFISPASYVRAVQRAGGRPILLLPDPEDTEDPNGVLDLVDALILTGGAGDVNPVLYGQERHPETGPIQEERDAYELVAARAAGYEKTPVKSHHHQGIGEVGDGLLTTGWATEDDAIEALEDPSRPFMLGVLWHPEEDEKSKLIEALVKEVS